MKRCIFIFVCLLCSTLYGATLDANHPGAKNDTTNVAGSNKTFGMEIVKPEFKWEIYPNPVVDILHIKGLEGFYTIKMVNAVGQVVVSIKGISDEVRIDMNGKPAGMYLLKIESQGKSITRKVVKK